MDELERVKLARKWARRFSLFYGYPPAMIGVISACLGGIVVFFFIGIAQLDFSDLVVPWFITNALVFLAGFSFARLVNREAAKALEAELDRLQ